MTPARPARGYLRGPYSNLSNHQPQHGAGTSTILTVGSLVEVHNLYEGIAKHFERCSNVTSLVDQLAHMDEATFLGLCFMLTLIWSALVPHLQVVRRTLQAIRRYFRDFHDWKNIKQLERLDATAGEPADDPEHNSTSSFVPEQTIVDRRTPPPRARPTAAKRRRPRGDQST